MTVLAAKGEHSENRYAHFNDVISFNDKDDIHNFPSLWEGNPPMAPVDPAYCEASVKLKLKFISFCRLPELICQLNAFTKRIEILWDAVLKENFIFSFRNTLEVEAYGLLDAEFSKWSWRLHNVFLQWQNTIRNLVRSCQISELDKTERDQVGLVHSKLDNEYQFITKDVSLFYEDTNSPYTSLMVKWRAEYEQRVKNVRDNYKEKAQAFCMQLIQNRRANNKVEHIETSHREWFKDRVKNLVSTRNITKESKISDAELNKIFNDEWEKWMKELKESYPFPKQLDIERKISDVLRRKKSQSDKDITTKLWACPLEKRGQPLQLTISSDKHINVCYSTYFTHLGKPDISRFVKIANELTLQCFSFAASYLSQPDISYDDAHIHQLIDIVYRAVDESQKKEKRFTFSNDYRLDLILQVCGYAFHVFTEKQQEKN